MSRPTSTKNKPISTTIGKLTTFTDLKDGQAFYFQGCYGLGVKIERKKCMIIDSSDHRERRPGQIVKEVPYSCDIYEVSKSLAECLEAL